MIHEAYMPVYMGSRFSLRTGGRVRGFTRGSTRGPRGPKNGSINVGVREAPCKKSFGILASYWTPPKIK